MSIDRWPSREGVAEEIRKAGFANVELAELLMGGVAIHEASTGAASSAAKQKVP